MSPNGRWPSLLVLISCAVVVAGCGDEENVDRTLPAGAAARVGDTVITEAQVRARVAAVFERFHGTLDSTSFGPPEFQECVGIKRFSERRGSGERLRRECLADYRTARAEAVGFLISVQWLDMEADRRDVKFAGEYRRQMNFLAVAPATRRTANGYRFVRIQARTSAQYLKLAETETATEQEIQALGKAQPATFLTPEAREAQIVQASSKQKAASARKELKGGAGWERVRDRYGVEPAAWVGLQTISKTAAPTDAFGKALFAAEPKQLSGPVKASGSWFVFKVTAVRPPGTKLSPVAHENAKQAVRGRKLNKALKEHYGDETICAKQYQVPAVPTCSKGKS